MRRPDTQFTAYISYLEIYNEQGYDLLDPSHETKSLEELPYDGGAALSARALGLDAHACFSAA